MTVSVIIPCYNAEPYLGQAIGSALAQSRPPDEVVVVDDGSTDGSRAVAEGFGDRVRVFSERNGSASRTRAHGLAHATGDALLFLDADDVLGPDALEALVAELEAHPGSVAACPWYRLELHDGAWVRRPPSCAPRRPGQDPLEAWLDGWYHPPCSVLWSREAYERAGGWDERGGPNDDGYLMMRALARGVPLRLTAGGSAFYRRLPEGDVSFSGTRLTEGGLQAWVWVIGQIAHLLEERGTLGPYRRALGDAFDRLVGDARGRFPDLAATAGAHRRQYGEPGWRRAARRGGRRARRALRRLRQRAGRHRHPGPRGPEPPPEEVRFGLDVPSADS